MAREVRHARRWGLYAIRASNRARSKLCSATLQTLTLAFHACRTDDDLAFRLVPAASVARLVALRGSIRPCWSGGGHFDCDMRPCSVVRSLCPVVLQAGVVISAICLWLRNDFLL